MFFIGSLTKYRKYYVILHYYNFLNSNIQNMNFNSILWASLSFLLLLCSCSKDNTDDSDTSKYDFSGIYISVDKGENGGLIRSLDGSFEIYPSHGVCQISTNEFYGHTPSDTYNKHPQPFKIYKNDKIYLSVPAGESSTWQVGSIVAVGNDVYSCVYNTPGQGASVYKNQEFLYNIEYSDGDTWRLFQPKCIATDGDDIYVGGAILKLGVQHSVFQAAIWKNGKLHYILTDGGDYDTCEALTISEGHVYGCGEGGNTPAIWKDGIKLTISPELENRYGILFDMDIYNGDVYACGAIQVPRGTTVSYDGLIVKNGDFFQTIAPINGNQIKINSILIDNSRIYTSGVVSSTTYSEKEDGYTYSIKGAVWEYPSQTPFYETEVLPWNTDAYMSTDFNVWLLKP